MKAMIVKEFRQMRRDKRAMGLMIGLPVMLLVIFGYAARFDVGRIQTVVVGPNAVEVSRSLDAAYDVVEVDATGDRQDVERMLRNSEVEVGIVTGGGPSTMLVDGSELFVAQSALRRIPAATIPEILFDPDLDTAPVRR